MKPKKPLFDAEGYQTNIKDLNGTPLPDLSKVKARSFVGRKQQPSLRAASPKPAKDPIAGARF